MHPLRPCSCIRPKLPMRPCNPNPIGNQSPCAKIPIGKRCHMSCLLDVAAGPDRDRRLIPPERCRLLATRCPGGRHGFGRCRVARLGPPIGGPGGRASGQAIARPVEVPAMAGTTLGAPLSGPGGTVPPIGGTVSCRAGGHCRPADRPGGRGAGPLPAREWYRPIGRHGVPPANSPAVMSRRAIARHGVGGGVWQGPVGALQRTSGGVLFPAGSGAACWRHDVRCRLWSARRTVPAMAGAASGPAGRHPARLWPGRCGTWHDKHSAQERE